MLFLFLGTVTFRSFTFLFLAPTTMHNGPDWMILSEMAETADEPPAMCDDLMLHTCVRKGPCLEVPAYARVEIAHVPPYVYVRLLLINHSPTAVPDKLVRDGGRIFLKLYPVSLVPTAPHPPLAAALVVVRDAVAALCPPRRHWRVIARFMHWARPLVGSLCREEWPPVPVPRVPLTLTREAR